MTKTHTENASLNKQNERILALACEVLQIESAAVFALIERIDAQFLNAVHLILNCDGRIIVSGIGKSGHIARKIASTMASTGTPAFFVHPAEASHGDLGMIIKNDVLIAISNSGESDELLHILPFIKRQGAKLIAITGEPASTLAKEADVHLNAHVKEEACPLNLAPTASTTAVLALGDALAIALLDARGFGAADFARSHPGGALGRKLLIRLKDVMRQNSDIPTNFAEASVTEATREISRGRIGMTVIIAPDKKVLGIFTDGDLRRAVVDGRDISSLKVAEIMTKNPYVMRADKLAAEAVKVMEQRRINQIPVVDENGFLIGALNMHDLFNAKAL